MNQKLGHKEIGEKYKLFFFHEQTPGQVILLPKGNLMFKLIHNYIRRIMQFSGYLEISSPSFGHQKIWNNTQHTNKYNENIFYLNDYILKPMNCPMHMIIAKKIYSSASNLPIKLFEFNYCYRNEKTGSLCGLFRLTRFTQDDSHTICEIQNSNHVIINFINIVKEVYGAFGFATVKFRLSKSKKDEFIGTPEEKIILENKLLECLNITQTEYTESDDGAFYAPKIDVLIEDTQKREWQVGTIQIDKCLLKNSQFTLQNEHRIEDVCVIHQAILGTFERFMGILLEHHQQVPSIINPYQVAIIAIKDTEQSQEYIQQIIDVINQNHNIHEVDIVEDKHINAKMQKARKRKYNYVIVVGEAEIKEKMVQVHNNITKSKDSIPYTEICKYIR